MTWQKNKYTITPNLPPQKGGDFVTSFQKKSLMALKASPEGLQAAETDVAKLKHAHQDIESGTWGVQGQVRMAVRRRLPAEARIERLVQPHQFHA